MGKLSTIVKSVGAMTGRSGLVLRKHSPEILMGTGVVGIIGSTVLACRATLRAHEVIEKANENLTLMKQAREQYPEQYTDIAYKKELAITYGNAGLGFAKLYGPAVILGSLSVLAMIGSHKIMKTRNLALIGAYKAIDKSFKEYRQRVVTEFGEDKDRMLKNGVVQNKLTITETDEKGKVRKRDVVIESVEGISQYARFFDENSTQWSKTPEYNLTFLKCQQNWVNDQLQTRGHVFLNEVYDLIGVPRTQAGAVVGWVKDHGDNYIDFGLFDGKTMQARDFVNGYERSILLDFNVDGVIYDLI